MRKSSVYVTNWGGRDGLEPTAMLRDKLGSLLGFCSFTSEAVPKGGGFPANVDGRVNNSLGRYIGPTPHPILCAHSRCSTQVFGFA